jgi:hypothetical protein
MQLSREMVVAWTVPACVRNQRGSFARRSMFVSSWESLLVLGAQ